MGATFQVVLLLAILVTASSATPEFSTSCYENITVHEPPNASPFQYSYTAIAGQPWTLQATKTTDGLKFSLVSPGKLPPVFTSTAADYTATYSMNNIIIRAPKSSTSNGCEPGEITVEFSDNTIKLVLYAYIFTSSAQDEKDSEAVLVELLSEKQIQTILKNQGIFTSDLSWLSEMAKKYTVVKRNGKTYPTSFRARPMIVREDLWNFIASVNTT